jgi:hypothetical protein
VVELFVSEVAAILPNLCALSCGVHGLVTSSKWGSGSIFCR